MRQFINKAQLLVSSTKGRAALVIALLALGAIAGGADGNSGP
jgi:hypothetical protein